MANRRLQDVQERLPVAAAAAQPVPPRPVRRRRRRGRGRGGRQEGRLERRVRPPSPGALCPSAVVLLSFQFITWPSPLSLSLSNPSVSAESGTNWKRCSAVWLPGGATWPRPCCSASTVPRRRRRSWSASPSLSPSSRPPSPRRHGAFFSLPPLSCLAIINKHRGLWMAERLQKKFSQSSFVLLPDCTAISSFWCALQLLCQSIQCVLLQKIVSSRFHPFMASLCVCCATTNHAHAVLTVLRRGCARFSPTWTQRTNRSRATCRARTSRYRTSQERGKRCQKSPQQLK